MKILELLSFIAWITLVSGDYCFDESTAKSAPMRPEDMNVKFLLFTCSNKDIPQTFTYLSDSSEWKNTYFNPNTMTRFIVHGWKNKYSTNSLIDYDWMEEMKNLFLGKACINVVAVDWSEPASQNNYTFSSKSTRFVGQMIGCVVNRLRTDLGLKPDNIQLSGHSLGSHVIGFAGKQITGPKVRQIVSLDPAGPDFYDVGDSNRISVNDAQNVLVIHTNTGRSNLEGAGLLPPVGNIDFYPNGGHQQPGCGIIPFVSDISLDCNHVRSIRYSIGDQNYSSPQKCQIIGYNCQSYDEFKLGKCADCGSDGNGCKPMPHNLDFWDNKQNWVSNAVHKQYFVDTGNVETSLFSTQSYCLNHYQIIVFLKALKSDKTCFGDISIRLSNGKQIDIKLESKNTFPSNIGIKRFTKLFTDSKELGVLSSAQLNTYSVDKDCVPNKIEFNYMSSIDASVRKTKSSTLCSTDGKSFTQKC